jgi:hypothetical protein
VSGLPKASGCLVLSRADRLAALLGDGRRELGVTPLPPSPGWLPRSYALARVLEHGPMALEPLAHMTRWPADEVARLLGDLVALGLVRRLNFGFPGRDVFEAMP